MKEKIQNSIDKINLISKKMGFNNSHEKTIINQEDTEYPDKKLLTLQSGNWNTNEPWFIIDKNDKIHTMISIDTFLQIIQSLQKAQEENFNLKLEKTIWQNIPLDFNDVWTVAMAEVKKQIGNSKDKKTIGINTKKIVQDIKRKYPNLFLNLDMYLPPNLNGEIT